MQTPQVLSLFFSHAKTLKLVNTKKAAGFLFQSGHSNSKIPFLAVQLTSVPTLLLRQVAKTIKLRLQVS